MDKTGREERPVATDVMDVKYSSVLDVYMQRSGFLCQIYTYY